MGSGAAGGGARIADPTAAVPALRGDRVRLGDPSRESARLVRNLEVPEQAARLLFEHGGEQRLQLAELLGRDVLQIRGRLEATPGLQLIPAPLASVDFRAWGGKADQQGLGQIG